ncbi:sensor histidine kinase [Cohnella silvisoli]|uniref:histidine kinase n=1 Tax=Cohnella silvisoli TaxID=2873699 RepID=A0ABV1KWH5_9BACL|nr:HAMP domain-containing sensor histidine kinase [Cohnella silvisoli]MCD9023992.1 HAMP domain-containing histidine kinase [Cohnella silvisoli]
MTAVSIKIKFSLFLAVLLSLTVLVLSVFVLQGIKDQQKIRMEKELLQQTRIANLSIKQAYLTSPPIEAQPFLRSRGQQFAMDLAVYAGLHVVLYDNAGKKVGDSVPQSPAYGVEEALSYAMKGKIAYQREGQSLYYLTPLQGPKQQMGVIQFQYSLAADIKFYNTIAGLFMITGGAVLAASFVLGYLYFRRATSAIIALNQAAEQIRREKFLISPPLRRKDELGQLSQGIYYMSSEIQNSMTAMKNEETKLRQAVDKLQKLEQQQKQFIGNISHEFKTPLTSIKAYSELMEIYRDDVTLQDDAVHHIRLETDRLTDMVEKILRLAALEKYDFEYQAERVDIRELLLDLIGRMKAKAERFEVAIVPHLNDAVIWADRESLVHIMINLLDNAIKYNLPGGQIVVSDHEAEGKVVIEVADTGIGIPEEARSKIFEPFYTVNKDRSRQTGGTGLGLALVKQLVEKHRGTIELISTDDGTTFRLCFPSFHTASRKEAPQ